MARDRDDRDDGEEEEERPRRKRRDERDEEEVEDRRPPQTTNPGSTKAAGIIWVIMGSLVLLSVLANFAVGVSNQADMGSMLCGLALPALIGAVFLMVGVQTLKGSAKGTLANGIGSIIFAALIGGLGALLLLGSAFVGAVAAKGGGPAGAAGGLAATVLMIAAVIYIATGAMLLVAGILAIKGKNDYLRWRKYLRDQKVHPRSRDRYRDKDEDEEDERPKRKRPRDEDDDEERPRKRRREEEE